MSEGRTPSESGPELTTEDDRAALPAVVPQRRPVGRGAGGLAGRAGWQRALDVALDALDYAADRVADVTGVRRN